MFLKSKQIDKFFINVFVSRMLDYEKSILFNVPNEKKDYSKFITILEHTEDKIVVAANFNYGLTPYNIFTFTDFTVTSLYTTAYLDYSKIWQNAMSLMVDGYKSALDNYNDDKFELNFIP